jgi:hypothetical protein
MRGVLLALVAACTAAEPAPDAGPRPTCLELGCEDPEAVSKLCAADPAACTCPVLDGGTVTEIACVP